MYERTRSPFRVYALNKTFGDGADVERGDWKREIESGERRGDVRNTNAGLIAPRHSLYTLGGITLKFPN